MPTSLYSLTSTSPSDHIPPHNKPIVFKNDKDGVLHGHNPALAVRGLLRLDVCQVLVHLQGNWPRLATLHKVPPLAAECHAADGAHNLRTSTRAFRGRSELFMDGTMENECTSIQMLTYWRSHMEA